MSQTADHRQNFTLESAAAFNKNYCHTRKKRSARFHFLRILNNIIFISHVFNFPIWILLFSSSNSGVFWSLSSNNHICLSRCLGVIPAIYALLFFCSRMGFNFSKFKYIFSISLLFFLSVQPLHKYASSLKQSSGIPDISLDSSNFYILCRFCSRRIKITLKFLSGLRGVALLINCLRNIHCRVLVIILACGISALCQTNNSPTLMLHSCKLRSQ